MSDATSNNASEQPHDVMWTETIDDELYVYHRGKLIYKRWNNDGTSMIFNEAWPNASPNRRSA